MFATNQVCTISGKLESGALCEALDFALKYSGYIKGFTEPGNLSKCIYQITEDGQFCIGWAPQNKVPDGWTEFPFEFNSSIISQIIEQHLDKQKIQYCFGEGGYYKGFCMKDISGVLDSEYDGIKNPFYGIVLFKPFTCFYRK